MFQSQSFVYCPVVFTFVTAYNFQNKMLAKCKDASGIFFFKQFAEVPGEISFLWSDNFGDMFHLLRALNFSRSQKFPNVRQKPIFYVITYRQTFLLFSREKFFILAEK